MLNIPDIPDSEKTPVVLSLLEIIRSQSKEIQLLKAEIARLKNRPGRPNLTPSKISSSEKRSSSKKQQSKSGKTKKIEIHDVVTLHPDNLHKGSTFIYYKSFTVQDIECKPKNTKYRSSKGC